MSECKSSQPGLGSLPEAAREGTGTGKTEALLLWPLLHLQVCHLKGGKATPDTWLPLYCLFSFIFISKPEDYRYSWNCSYTSVPEPSLCWGEGVVVLPTVSMRVNNADDSSTVEPRLLSEIYTNTYAGGGTVEGGVSGVELNTGLGAAAGLAAGGAAGTVGRRSSAVGIQRDYADTGLNLAFLDSYFSEVTSLHRAPQNSLGTE